MKDSNLPCLTPPQIPLARSASSSLGPGGRWHSFLKNFTSSAFFKKIFPDISASLNLVKFFSTRSSFGCVFWIHLSSSSLSHPYTFSIIGCSSKVSWWSICSESQLVDEIKMMRSRWNEEVEITELLTCCLRISFILHLHGIPGGMFIHGGVRAVGWRREPRGEETRRRKGKHIAGESSANRGCLVACSNLSFTSNLNPLGLER
jgi:hypothetical protein